MKKAAARGSPFWTYRRRSRRVPENDERDVDPQEFLRALLKISPEDAEKARESSPDDA
jgi:hypothetical protein